MRDDRVQLGVVVNSGQITIVLNGDQWIRTKWLQRELIRTVAERPGVERRAVPIEHALHDVEYSRLSSTALAIQHNELLQISGITGDYCSDGP